MKMDSKTPRKPLRQWIPGREPRPATEDAHAIRRYRADELLGPCPWIVIEHRGAEYRLQVTRLGKLILTK